MSAERKFLFSFRFDTGKLWTTGARPSDMKFGMELNYRHTYNSCMKYYL